MPMPRKPLALHELHGTVPNGRVDNPLIPAGRPRYPKGLTKAARKVFKHLCSLLESRRTLTEGEYYLLQMYAEVWDRRGRAQAKLLAEGEIRLYNRLDPNGVAHQIEKPNLNMKIVEVAEKQLVAILDRLGLTPASASKIKQTGAPARTVVPGSMEALHPTWFKDGKFIGTGKEDGNVQ